MQPTFFAAPTHYTTHEFRLHLASLTLTDWRPAFPTLHNTGVPSLAQWRSMGVTPQERWGANLNRYYRGLGWHAGPHIVVCPDYIWVLCDLAKPGVSVSCWNSRTIGIEMVGDFEVDADDFDVGDGAKVRDNAIAALVALDEKFDWGDLSDIALGVRGLHFHHECNADHHACPGSKVSKAAILDSFKLARARSAQSAGEANPPVLNTAFAAASANQAQLADNNTIRSISDIQSALNRLGAMPKLVVDGVVGPTTIAAVRRFQEQQRCHVEAWPGAETCAAIAVALAISAS